MAALSVVVLFSDVVIVESSQLTGQRSSPRQRPLPVVHIIDD